MAKANIKRILSGTAIGAVNGFFGGGGGMLTVPLLSNLGYVRKQAHATAILIIAPICLVSAAVYIYNGYLDIKIVLPATLGNVAGGMLGGILLGKLPEIWVQAVFVIIMLAAGIRTVIG